MRALIVLVSLVMGLTACPLERRTKDSAIKANVGGDWPTGYKAWPRINPETIINEDEEVAREIYAKTTAGLGQGTVLVKAQYALEDGEKGALELVAVMRRTGGTAYNGWEFIGLDPLTQKRNASKTESCVGCHSLWANNDYMKTPKSKF